MQFGELMKKLAERIGGGLDLTPDESGAITLAIDQTQVMILSLEELSSVALYSLVAVPPPEEHIERLYQSALEANHALAQKSGATLSLNHETGEIYLCSAMPLDSLDGESFALALEDFVDVHGKWSRVIADFRGGKASSVPESTESSFGNFMQV